MRLLRARSNFKGRTEVGGLKIEAVMGPESCERATVGSDRAVAT